MKDVLVRLFVHRKVMRNHFSHPGVEGSGLICEYTVAEKANLCLEDFLAVWTGDDSRMCCQGEACS